MEVVGVVASAITLAGLFKTCIDAFDTIQLYKNQEADLKKLFLRLNVEKCRLYVWGRSMRLTSGSARNALQDCPFQDVVSECLKQIIDLFNNSDQIQEKYGCQILPPESATKAISAKQNYSVRTFAAAFGNFRIRAGRGRGANAGQQQQLVVVQKTLWVVKDRKRFDGLIQEVQNLIDGLLEITKDLASADKQEEDIASRIMGIRDVGTLQMVADVCETSHPHIAYAASSRADSVSMATSRRNKIVQWRAQVESDESDGTSVAHLEDLTVTELKYQVTRLLRDNLERSRIAVAQPAPNQTDEAAQSVETLRETIGALERERDFYFSKLRDIELYLQVLEDEQPNASIVKDDDGWFKTIQNILYAVIEGFEIPKDEDPDPERKAIADTPANDDDDDDGDSGKAATHGSADNDDGDSSRAATDGSTNKGDPDIRKDAAMDDSDSGSTMPRPATFPAV